MCGLFVGLLVRFDSTWTKAWPAAAATFVFMLLFLTTRLLSPPWARWTARGLALAAAVIGVILVSGAVGHPYRLLGVMTLTVLARQLWATYQGTDHYRAHKDTPFSRMIAWIVTFEDPDRP